jgi:2-oxoglutarate dehydrogenase E1 component
LSAQLLDLPADLTLHDRVKKILERRQKMTLGEIPIDWGYAETMAYANLLTTGYPVRLTGQDSGRGTFFHRHAVLHDQTQDRNYTPLQHLSAHQANFLVVDSLLSEEAVLGFEYGYATADPSALVLWEAQFGDFANGAQVVIDQFIASGESKWGRLCSLVMLLPHGFEGQGPEHSSARLERYLQLCAEHNIQVCVPTTPAQMFHLLLRQMLRSFRKPLVVMTCKSMLRNKAATSSLNDLTSGSFEPVISDKSLPDNDAVHRIVVCSGKVYYDLIETRRELQRDDTAIIRLEQIYPFPRALLARAIESFPNATELVWCQEEPHNQGAWDQIKHRFRTLLGDHMKMRYAGRASSAAPAVGNLRVHRQQQQDLINDAIE